jgi:glucose-1-phosphate cytidylyltransferase
VRHLVQDEEMFLATYADVLTDVDINLMIANLRDSNAVATLLAAPPQAAFHCLELGDSQSVERIHLVTELPVWVNGGYFVLRPEVFDYLPENGDLIGNACTELAKEGRMMAHRHRGWWQPADTVKERMALEAAYQAGTRPWMPWERADRSPLQALIQAELAR